nr:hypothetical protein GCM10020092_037330 [Actinoplanes digitatis]
MITQPAGAVTVADSARIAPGPSLRAVVTRRLVAPDCNPSGAVKVRSTAGCRATVSGSPSCVTVTARVPAVAGTSTTSRRFPASYAKGAARPATVTTRGRETPANSTVYRRAAGAPG